MPYAEGGRTLAGLDCYGLVRLAAMEIGCSLPSSQAEAAAMSGRLARPLFEGESPRAGDIVAMAEDLVPRSHPHYGILIDDGFCVLHAARGSGVVKSRLSTLRRGDPGLKVLRLVEADSRRRLTECEAELVERGDLVAVSLVVVTDPLHSGVVRRDMVLCDEGTSARKLAEQMTPEMGTCQRVIVLNGRPFPSDMDAPLKGGQTLLVAPLAGEPTTVILAVVGILSAAASILLAPKLPKATGGDEPAEKRYGFSRISSEAFAGDTVPVVLGTRVFGGKLISAIPGEGSDGSGDSTLRVLLCMGEGGDEGGISSLAGRTSDFDGVAHDAAGVATGIELNDQPLSSFPGCRVWGRLGSTSQAAIPGFDDTEVLREVGAGGVSIPNTSGADRTGGSPSSEAFTFATSGPVDYIVPRVRFPRGLFTTTGSGQLETRRVQWRLRTQPFGGGTWSAWQVFTVSRAEQSEFYSAPRVAVPGAPARVNVQIERVTRETGSAADVDSMVWDSLVEVVEATNTFAGYAMLALELKATDQLTGVPRVSVEVGGVKVRRWDGVSPASLPVFTVGSSSNPADHALALLTSETWGLGGIYTDAAIDFESLLSWHAKCAATVARPGGGGGTRTRFRCDIVLGAARDAVEHLRTICRTGRCTPVLSGGVWRFIVDDVQSSPVERFGDGDILVDESGMADFEYLRDLGTGGLARPTQVLIQFENAAGDDAPDAIEFPAAGELWLATEPVVPEQVRLDGVTDVDQAAAEAVYTMKKARFLTRGVRFKTTREVVVVQPGDRFDLAMSLPGWGVASGRVAAGSTTTGLRLDRSIVVPSSPAWNVIVSHLDGSVETRGLTPGTYAAGSLVGLTTAMAQAAGLGASYAVGAVGTEMKPFTCTRVRLADVERRIWEIEGIEYDDEVYDDADLTVEFPDYSTLGDLRRPPGPMLELRAYERLEGLSGGQVRRVSLAWRQAADDAQATALFRVWRRTVGTTTWVLVPDPKIGGRGAVLDVFDLERAYEFVVVAVSQLGAALSPDDPRHPRATLVLGLSALPPAAPTGLAITQTAGNTYRLSWDAADGAVGYQVLFGGDTTSRPNAGAEDCLVLARTVENELAGLELPPGRACRFWVRSVGESGRMSFTAAEVAISSPATPGGETIKQTRVLALDSEGTRTNVAWDAGQSRLELVSGSSPGVYLSPEVDPGSSSLTELTVRPSTANDAADVQIITDPFSAPSIAADQWGVISTGPSVVGMLFPPWPDNVQTWTLEVRTKEAGVWSDWETVPWLGSVRRVFREWQVRVTMTRTGSPYRPALRGLAVVLTN